MSRELGKSMLGDWASHPSTLKIRHRRWMLIGAAPVAAALVVMLFLWRFGGVSLLGLMQTWDTWLPLVMGLLAFGGAMALTASLSLRASTIGFCQGFAKGRGPTAVATWVVATTVVVLGAFVLSRGSVVGAVFAGDSLATTRLLGHVVGTLPMLLLLLLVDLCVRPVDQWGNAEQAPVKWKAGAWRAARLLWQVGIYISVMITIDRIAAWVDHYEQSLRGGAAAEPGFISRLLQWVPGLGPDVDTNVALADFIAGSRDWISAVVALGALVLLVVFLTKELFTRIQAKRSQVAPIAPEGVIATQGYLQTPAGEVWGLPRGVERPARSAHVLWERDKSLDDEGDAEASLDVGDAASSSLPAWFRKLQEASGIRGDAWGAAQRLPSGEVSRSTFDDALSHLFPTVEAPDGQRRGPTRDQEAALREFDRIYDRFLESEDREQKHVYPALDLLVTGAPGAGKTSLLLACAINTVVTRGQAVLVLVPTLAKSRLFVDRLRELAANSGVGWHVAVGELSQDEVRSWSDPLDSNVRSQPDARFRSPVGSLPDILVGTPTDYERLIYGEDHGGATIRRALLRMQTVLIEDLTTFVSEERRHLPFLLEKHRLVLRSEHVPTQFLALAPDLTDELARQIGKRLFTEREETYHLKLRPPKRDLPWVVDLVAAGSSLPNELAEQLMRAAGRADLDAVLWRPGTSPQECRRLEAQWQHRVRVIADIDELGAEDQKAAALAVYRSNTTLRANHALCARLDNEDAVVVCVTTAAGAARSGERRWSLPVLPSVESQALSVAHLKSAARFLAAWTPIPRDYWARMGLRGAGQLEPAAQTDVRFAAVPYYSLVLDPPEGGVSPGDVAARGHMWPWVAVKTEGARPESSALPMCAPNHVPLQHPLSRGEQFRVDEARARVRLGSFDADEQASAAWFTNDGQSLHRMDLAYADYLLQRRDGLEFWPESIEAGGNDDEAARIRAKSYEAKGDGENYMAVWDLEVRIPADTQLTFSQGGVAGSHIRWATLLNSNVGAAQPVEARFWLSGTFHEMGGTAPIRPPLDVYYASHVGMLRIGAPDDSRFKPGVDPSESQRQSLFGSWSTQAQVEGSQRAWSILGLALTAELRRALAGIFEYARMACFHGPAGTAFEGCAYLLFVEPSGTRGTVRDAIERMLGEREMLEDLCVNVVARLAAVRDQATREHQLEILYVEAGVQIGRCVVTDDSLTADIDAAISLMNDLDACLQSGRARHSARRGASRDER